MNLERKTAGEAIIATNQLAQCSAFDGWFMDHLRAMANSLADTVLHDDHSPEQREILRQKRLTVLEIIALPAEARLSAEDIIRDQGADDSDDDLNDGIPKRTINAKEDY